MDTPLLDMLRGLKGRSWLHMPGHGGELPWLDPALDVTEMVSSDDMMSPAHKGAFEQAQALTAQAIGAGSTCFLTGGATLGIQAMIMTYVPPGGKIILPRDAHKSAMAACILGDLSPIYVWPQIKDQVAFYDPQEIIKVMYQHPDASAILLTRPNYYGLCIDLAKIVSVANQFGIKVLVDEAHGAHLPYVGASCSLQKVTAWVQSAHKTLPSLTQSAYLHMRDPMDRPRVNDMLCLLGSSSPSFLLAASLDWARASMQEHGACWIADTIARNQEFLHQIADFGYRDTHALWTERGYTCDATRLVVDVRNTGSSGYDVLQRLSVLGIDLEMADGYHIVAMPPLAAEKDVLLRMKQALLGISCKTTAFSVQDIILPSTRRALSPRQAFLGNRKAIPLQQAQGMVLAQAIGLYPPGIALVMPGEVISQEVIDTITQRQAMGATMFGSTGNGDVWVCIQ